MSAIVEKPTVELEHIAIYLDSLRVDSVLDFDLFIQVKDKFVLYRSADLPFTETTRQKLIENHVERLFITGDCKIKYQRYIEQNLGTILDDPKVKEDKKANILYETSTSLVKDVLSNPTYGENIRRSKDLVSNTVNYILSGREAFHNLLKITSYDYYTYTHSVNVSTFSVALAQQMGYTDKKFLYELGIGALLHDIGKSKLPDRILNKRSALNSVEFEIMKKHPKWGIEILTDTDEIPAASYYPILQHHERGDGSGYPSGLSLAEMHIYSRIVAIADSFDAMTTERVYQKAMDTYPSLKVMFSLEGAYDEEALRAFVHLMGPEGVKTD
ncbi:MAG: HD-GYP domain-containing protein [Candidatus Zixiibacteriota bacterium]|nr:MAG: HD-GYP domain-containing protein [candidate division Zixibacteria bacterium]